MNHSEHIMTGGDGQTGQTGLDIITAANVQFEALMGVKEYIPSDFVWTGDLSGLENKILIISNSHNVAGAIALPAGVLLYFEGFGQLLNITTITGSNSKIINSLNRQIFSSTTVFAGSWVETEATPQWWGAVCSPNVTTLEAGGAVDSRAAIQALFDSPFAKRIPAGNYYRKGLPNVLAKPMSVFCGRGLIMTRNNSYVPKTDNVTFYTDDNNGFFEVQSSEVYFEGFTCDFRQAATYTSPVIFAKADYKIWGGVIKASIIGLVSHCRTATGGVGSGVPPTDWVGAKGFEWITKDTVAIYGYLCDMTIDLQTQNVAYPIVIPEASTSGVTGTWITTMRVRGTYVAYRSLYIVTGSVSNHEFVMQTGYTIPTADLETIYSGYVGKSVLNCFPWDLNGTEGSGSSAGYHYSKKGIIIQNDTILVGYSNVSKSFGGIIGLPSPTPNINNLSDIEFFFDRWSVNSFISPLHNRLIGFETYGGTYTIKAYDGSTIDFDTNLDEGTESETANITITDGDKMLSFERETILHMNPPRWQFGAEADLDKDFVELFLDCQNNTVSIANLYAFMYETSSTGAKRMQVILTNTSDVKSVYNFPISDYRTFGKNIYRLINLATTCKKIVVRFIGATSTTGQIMILDFAVKGKGNINNLKYRHEFDYELNFYATQSGTDNPVAEIMEPATLRYETFNRTGQGIYHLFAYNNYEYERIMPRKSVYVDDVTGYKTTLMWVNNNRMEIRTYNETGVLTDGILDGTQLFQIRKRRKV